MIELNVMIGLGAGRVAPFFFWQGYASAAKKS